MRFTVSALGAICAVAAATAAQAQNANSGFYMAARVGSASLSDPDVSYYDVGGTFGGTGTRDTATANLETKSAVTFGGSLGYDFGMVRADLEVDYARHNIDSVTFVGINGSAVTLSPADRVDVCDYLEASSCGGSGNTFVIDGSRVRQLSAMGNLWLDIPVGGTITPYVGGGLGIAGFEVDGEGKGKFAWQLGAGVAVNVSETVAITVDYRHRQVGRTVVEYDSASGFEIDKLKTDAITAGLRFIF